jgi:hypothetical protein
MLYVMEGPRVGGAEVDEDTAYTHLQMAARYLQKITKLQPHFQIITS